MKRRTWFFVLALILIGVTFSGLIPKPVNAQATTLQGFTLEACANLQTGGTVVLTDNRNNQTYRVRKFADNNCWMIDNMKLAGVTLTPANSDVTSNVTLPAAATSGTSNDTSIQIWDGSTQTYCATASNFAADSTTRCGYHYNWMAATAGTGTAAITNADAPASICPKGWRLPPVSGQGSFYNLYHQGLGSTAANMTNDVTGFSSRLTGLYGSSWTINMGSYGFYWLRSAYSVAGTAHSMLFIDSYVDPQHGDGKGNGLSVRCVFNVPNTTPSITTAAAQTANNGSTSTALTNSYVRNGNKLYVSGTITDPDTQNFTVSYSLSSNTTPGSWTVCRSASSTRMGSVVG